MNAGWHRQHPMPRHASVEQRMAWHLQHQEHCRCRPFPPKLLQKLGATAPAASGRKQARSAGGRHLEGETIRALLTGGDRRSVAQSERARALLRSEPGRVPELAALAGDPDWLVSMRAMDLLEKLAHEHPEWVQPHKSLFLGPLAESDKWEIRLQVVRALPLLKWTPREAKRAIEILTRDIEHPQKFVRAWALDSLASFARIHGAVIPTVERGLGRFERSGSKALQARARQIRERMVRHRPE
jgi:hypothetical protein